MHSHRGSRLSRRPHTYRGREPLRAVDGAAAMAARPRRRSVDYLRHDRACLSWAVAVLVHAKWCCVPELVVPSTTGDRCLTGVMPYLVAWRPASRRPRRRRPRRRHPRVAGPRRSRLGASWQDRTDTSHPVPRRRWQGGPITTVAPSTTATALTSFDDRSRTWASTGIVGYRMVVRRRGVELVALGECRHGPTPAHVASHPITCSAFRSIHGTVGDPRHGQQGRVPRHERLLGRPSTAAHARTGYRTVVDARGPRCAACSFDRASGSSTRTTTASTRSRTSTASGEQFDAEIVFADRLVADAARAALPDDACRVARHRRTTGRSTCRDRQPSGGSRTVADASLLTPAVGRGAVPLAPRPHPGAEADLLAASRRRTTATMRGCVSGGRTDRRRALVRAERCPRHRSLPDGRRRAAAAFEPISLRRSGRHRSRSNSCRPTRVLDLGRDARSR